MKNKPATKKNKFHVNSFKVNHKEFIKISKLILKSQQRFRIKKKMYLLKKLARLH